MTASSERKLTGRGVLLWLAGFFGVIIATNVLFVAVSVATFRGEDEQKPYLQGIAYNHTLAQRAEQKAAGWRAAISAARLADGDVRILLSLHGHDGAPVDGERLSGALRHPSDENRDHPLRLVEIGPGLYQADIHAVAPGSWQVQVHARGGRMPFEAERRLWVP